MYLFLSAAHNNKTYVFIQSQLDLSNLYNQAFEG